jgi:SAM-dependent MidA family methyltransferase
MGLHGYTTARKEGARPVDSKSLPSIRRGHPDLEASLIAEIAANGPISFARFMGQALYHPEFGYYVSPERRPGRGGDFLTAPETHPFFGLTIARQLVEMWERLGRPEPFGVREYGSGIGGLAYDVIVGMLSLRPEIRSALRYRFNEVNQHRVAQALAAMDEVGLGDLVDIDDGEPIEGVVLANEVADAMPVHRLLWTGSDLQERWVGWDGEDFGDVVGPLSPEVAEMDLPAYFARVGVDLSAMPVGAYLEVSPATELWVQEMAAGLGRGYALIIDYGYPVAELYRDHRLEGTVRAYSGHTVTDNPYRLVGLQDLTAHVDFSRLIEVGTEAGLTVAGLATQGDFLSGNGLGELLVDLQRQPDVAVEEYYRAQAATFRLIDPGGRGRFRVLGLARNAPVDPHLAGFAGPDLPPGLRL